MRIPFCVAAACFLAAPSLASAEPVADFYRGKQLSVIIRAAPGGNYDQYLRLLARHFVRHVPGNPTAVPMNMPGGGGLTALNYTENVAPHDGTAITMVTQTTPMDQALGLDKNLKVDMRRLNWLGNMSDENTFLVTKAESATKTLEDAKLREATLSATGAGGSEVILVQVLNNVLGTKFKNILGYRSSPEMNLAMQRGETEGRVTTNLRALFATTDRSDYHVIVQAGIKKDPNYPNVPLLGELGRNDDDRLALAFISRVMALARPVATNSDVPPERLAALRGAFDETMRDPEFLAEAKLQDLDVSPWTGPELERIVKDILDTPAPIKERIRQALQSSPAGEQKRGEK
jgi:tripartite-type tricarboxylate transporter receptor subunit TctC